MMKPVDTGSLSGSLNASVALAKATELVRMSSNSPNNSHVEFDS